jgi:hypothetical protein
MEATRTSLIPARYYSLNTLFTVIRHSNNLSDCTKSSISEMANMIGDTELGTSRSKANIIPSMPVNTNMEAAAELCKALHAFGTLSHMSLLIRSSWINVKGSHIISADLES